MTPLTFKERVDLRIAAADQQHLAMRMLTAFGAAGSLAPRDHPWVVGLGEQVLTQIADRRAALCPHLGSRGLEPMHGEFRAGRVHIWCRPCLHSRRTAADPVDDFTCDRCSTYTRRGLVLGVLPIGPLLLSFGVCRPCGAELAMVRAEANQ